MVLTTKGSYAVQLVIDVRQNAKDEPVRLEDSARRTGISVHYLEQIARRLRVAGILVSTRGPGGGYAPAAGIENVTLKDVFDAAGERQDYAGLTGLQAAVDGYLTQATVGQVS
jgi:Rrf2 family iron-sulfur cluster assembly transcriptional regulator